MRVWDLDQHLRSELKYNDTITGKVYDVVKNNPDTNFLVAFGKGEMDRYKSIEK